MVLKLFYKDTDVREEIMRVEEFLKDRKFEKKQIVEYQGMQRESIEKNNQRIVIVSKEMELTHGRLRLIKKDTQHRIGVISCNDKFIKRCEEDITRALFVLKNLKAELKKQSKKKKRVFKKEGA